MGSKNFGNEGLHHGKAKRTQRSRDGQSWDPDGDGVPAKQFGGHDGGKSGKVGNPKAANKGKGKHHTS